MFFWKTNTILLFMMIMTIMIFLKKSPAKLIFSIVIFSSYLSIQITDKVKNPWVGFSLFFLMVSGLMIMFAMITSIMPKTNFKSQKNNTMSMLMLIPIIFLSLSNSMEILTPNANLNFKMQLFWLIIITLNLILMFISKLISSPEKTFRSKM